MRAYWLKEIILMGLLAVCCALSVSRAQEKVLLDLKRLADKPRLEVEKFLGPASKVTDDVFRSGRGYTYPALRAAYINGAVEVTYLERGARYFKIWVQKLGGKYQHYAYPKDTGRLLADLGLDQNTAADLSNETLTRWRNLPDIYEVSVFATPEKQIWYVHVVTTRIYE
ncbi:MAG TPA: hypothetical protein VJQ55_08710 [Candidatus Binatia bacterium]|nr:hypothetical protein [Candidatus Binatia bacterium]